MKNPMRQITLLVVLLAVTPLSNISAQDSIPVTVGDRVRVTAPDIDLNRYDGTIRVIGRNALTVDTLPIALESVTRLDIHRGRKSKSGTGALIGAGIGLVFLPTAFRFARALSAMGGRLSRRSRSWSVVAQALALSLDG